MSCILGINAYHADSSAALIKDGRLIAAVEEERFNRVKHWSGFPAKAVQYCLNTGGITAKDLHYICVNRNPRANLFKKIGYVLHKWPSISAIRNRLKNRNKIRGIIEEFCIATGKTRSSLRAQFQFVEHHRAHLCSSFLVSPFKEAALLSVDGFGDFLSCMSGLGSDNAIQILDEIPFPHSLGIFYLMITQYLGFPEYGAEYKVMGLAPYGKPNYLGEMQSLVQILNDGTFCLGLDYFAHSTNGLEMSWDNTAPKIGCTYTQKLAELFGPPRKPQEELTQKHKDIAASLQKMYEAAFFAMLNRLYHRTRIDKVCLAGGCAMNSVANGKIFDQTPFRDLFIQPAAGDSGGAIGAAFYVWNVLLKNQRSFVMEHAYWGPSFSDSEFNSIIAERESDFNENHCTVERVEVERLCRQTAEYLADGKIIGWFQGRMEWGPRALGNRSILCNPARPDMKDILNFKIKRRESFRPFAPSILREHVKDWFETDYDVPFMLQVYQVRENKRHYIPAVTHVDGSGRLQTVTEKQNPLYYRLICEFAKKTGVPILLNTSFNENEPIVCHPREALDCFFRTKMDVLVLGNFVIKRN